MRRISSLVWNDMRKIQKIGNRKKMTTRTIRAPRTTRSAIDVCSMPASRYARPRARSRSFSHCLMKTFDSAKVIAHRMIKSAADLPTFVYW